MNSIINAEKNICKVVGIKWSDYDKMNCSDRAKVREDYLKKRNFKIKK